MLALLKGHNIRFVDKLSELVLASSSSGGDPFDSVSSLSDNGKTNFWTIAPLKMQTKNGSRVEKKLLNFFQFKKKIV